MKKTNILKTVFTILLCSIFSMSYAADWYISTTGSDATGDGSMGNPWASLSKAQTSAASDDIIHVSGMIDFTLDPANTIPFAGTTTGSLTGIALTKSLTIQGTSSGTDGFNGTNGSITTRFLTITTSTVSLTLKNLKLANGGVESASTAIGGGAIYITNGTIIAENVIFDNNKATGNANLTGAAIYIGGTNASGLSFTNCVFSNNAADKAGALYINSWSADSTIQFQNCAFIGNESRITNGGAALFVRSNNTANSKLNLINCTVAKNKVLNTGNGGAIYLGAKSATTTEVNIINCTITENTTLGGAANGAGVVVLSKAGNFVGSLNIYNSIIEGNTAALDTYGDLSFSDVAPIAPGITTTVPSLKINNSIIGVYGSPLLAIPSGCIGATNSFNNQVGSVLDGKLAAFNTAKNSYALLSTSPAINYGDASYLLNLTPPVTTDQLGNTRTNIGSGTCNAGSIAEIVTLGLKKSTESSILVYRNANNQITVENTTNDTTGTITVYNTLGQEVAKVAVSGTTTTIYKNLTPGVYIVMLKNTAGSNAKKVIIN